MTIRVKMLSTIGAATALLMAVLFGFLYNIMLDSYVKLERQYALKDIQRTLAVLDERLSALDTPLSDWAGWDDTYEFIRDANAKYVESNLTDESLIGVNINFIMYLDSAGRKVFGGCVDLKKKESVEIPSGVQEHLAPESVLLRHTDETSAIKGILDLPEGPMLIASRPILDSRKKGPIRGSLVMGRYLDDEEISRLSQVTQLPIIFASLSEARLPSELSDLSRSGFPEKELIHLSVTSPQLLRGYVLIKDLYGAPSFVLQTDIPRQLYQQGLSHFRILAVSFTMAVLLFAVLLLLLLDEIILSRLLHLSQTVNSIGKAQDFGRRISMRGKDELSTVAESINGMLDSLNEVKQELEDERAKSEGIIAALGDGICILDTELRIQYQNKVHKDMMGERAGEYCYRAYEGIEHACGNCPVTKAFQDGEIHSLQKRSGSGDGFSEIEIKASVLRDSNGKAIAGIKVVRDITEQRRIEEQIRASLHEKEVLLKEVHHRVKNNLQIISSLLSLQMKPIQDMETVACFQDSQSRVNSMALVHEKLYQTADLTNINLRDYINDLAVNLFLTYGIDLNRIALKLDIRDIFLGIDTAIPLGLILNELLTNSLKHAFPEERPRPAGSDSPDEISVAVWRNEDESYNLALSDSGIGLPAGMELDRMESLGLRLISRLIDQLDGTFELRNSGGTQFKAVFREIKYKPRR